MFLADKITVACVGFDMARHYHKHGQKQELLEKKEFQNEFLFTVLQNTLTVRRKIE